MRVRKTLRRLAAVAVLVVAAGCEADRPLGDVRPDPLPDPQPKPTRIEYRVTGSIRAATITYTNSSAGTTIIVSDLPWFAAFDTMRERTFVLVEAKAPLTNFDEGFLIVQVFVNGELFREAVARGTNPVATVSGEVVR